VRWFSSLLFLLVRLSLSLCAVAFVLDSVEAYYAPMQDWVPPSVTSSR
jgi:hypothetical protein